MPAIEQSDSFQKKKAQPSSFHMEFLSPLARECFQQAWAQHTKRVDEEGNEEILLKGSAYGKYLAAQRPNYSYLLYAPLQALLPNTGPPEALSGHFILPTSDNLYLALYPYIMNAKRDGHKIAIKSAYQTFLGAYRTYQGSSLAYFAPEVLARCLSFAIHHYNDVALRSLFEIVREDKYPIVDLFFTCYDAPRYSLSDGKIDFSKPQRCPRRFLAALTFSEIRYRSSIGAPPCVDTGVNLLFEILNQLLTSTSEQWTHHRMVKPILMRYFPRDIAGLILATLYSPHILRAVDPIPPHRNYAKIYLSCFIERLMKLVKYAYCQPIYDAVASIQASISSHRTIVTAYKQWLDMRNPEDESSLIYAYVLDRVIKMWTTLDRACP